MKGVAVFDNTKGQIINFDQWLKKYPNRDKSGGKTNKWGSAKHAYSVEKCMELIKEPFVLLDSDVLIKRDFTPLFDEIVCYKGEVIAQSGTNNRIKRVLPYICFINTPMCRAKGIHYFDENYMHGLKYKGNSDNYDTGGAIYILTEKKKGLHREIKIADYVVHYGHGSWTKAAEKLKKPQKQIPETDWLNKYKDLWLDEPSGESTDNISFDDVFDHIYCLHYLPADDRLPKLREEFKRVGIDEDAGYFSWVYDYPSPLNDLVFKDPKLSMDTALKASSREYVKRVSLKHYEIIKEAYSLGYKRILIMEDDVRFHRDMWHVRELLSNIPDSDVVMFDKMVCSAGGEGLKYRQYVNSLPGDTLYGDMRASGVFFIFCSCYSLNRRAMERIIGAQEQRLLPPDTPLNDKGLTGSFAIVNLAIQDPKLKTRKNEGYDKIGLDTHPYGRIEPEPKPYTMETPVTPRKPAPKITRVGEKKDDGPTKGEALGISPANKIKESPGPVRRIVEKPVRFTRPEHLKPMVTRRLEPQVKTVMKKEKPPVPVVTRRVATREKAREVSTRNNTGKKVTGFNRLYDV